MPLAARSLRLLLLRLAAIAAVPPRRWDNLLTAIAHADGYTHIGGHRRYIEAAAGC